MPKAPGPGTFLCWMKQQIRNSPNSDQEKTLCTFWNVGLVSIVCVTARRNTLQTSPFLPKEGLQYESISRKISYQRFAAYCCSLMEIFGSRSIIKGIVTFDLAHLRHHFGLLVRLTDDANNH